MYKTLLDSQKSVLDTSGETSIFETFRNPDKPRRPLRSRLGWETRRRCTQGVLFTRDLDAAVAYIHSTGPDAGGEARELSSVISIPQFMSPGAKN